MKVSDELRVASTRSNDLARGSRLEAKEGETYDVG